MGRKGGYGSAFKFLLATPDTDDCVPWPFCKANGYGIVVIGAENHGAHRVSCALAHGLCPENMECRHLCGRKDCVNPKHLVWGTKKENCADRSRHGNDLRGKKNHMTKLTIDQVLYIRTSGKAQRSLAQELSVDISTINDVIRKKTWKYLNDAGEAGT